MRLHDLPAMSTDRPNRPYWTEAEVTQYLPIKRITLRHWRLKGEGPPYYKLGGRIAYKVTELDTWIEANKVG